MYYALATHGILANPDPHIDFARFLRYTKMLERDLQKIRAQQAADTAAGKVMQRTVSGRNAGFARRSRR